MSPAMQALKAAVEAAGAQNNPQEVYRIARQIGLSGNDVDRTFNLDIGTSNAWTKAQGLQDLVQGGGTGGANTGQKWAPSTPDSGQWGTTGIRPPDPTAEQYGMPGRPQQQRNPYMPATGGNLPLPNQGTNAAPNQVGTGAPGSQNPYMSSNPALPWMSNAIGQQLGQNLQRNILPGIRSAFSQAGGLGGSRQGIAEGIAIGDTMTGYGNTLANLYGNQFNQDRNYGLQNDALDLNVWQANQNAMRTGQQDQIGFGNQMLGMNQQYGVGNATQVQNTPMQNWQQFSSGASQLGGMGGTQSQNMQGNPYLSGLGGAVTGYNLYNQWNKPQGT